jgi:hypothetical protein
MCGTGSHVVEGQNPDLDEEGFAELVSFLQTGG